MSNVDYQISFDMQSRSMKWYDDQHPKLSIVILNFNKSDLTISCLKHIWRHTYGINYEVVVVDNGSRHEQFAMLAQNPGRYRLIRLPQNRFYGEGNNIGVESAKGDLVCLLNNDAFVTENWIEPLYDALNSEYSPGAVGPRFVYPDGRLQEVGAFIDSEGYSHQVGKFSLYQKDDLVRNRIVDYCSAACLILRKIDFLSVGGFDLVYEPAYYEDVDLCFKLRERGLLTYCCPASMIVHIENATTATHRSVLGEQTVDRNRRRFVARWHHFLSARHLGEVEPSTAIPAVDTRSSRFVYSSFTDRPRIAFYTPYDLTPGGGERYLLSAASAARAIADVILVTEHPYSQIRLASLSSELMIELSDITVVPRIDILDHLPIDICIIMANEVLPPIRGFGLFNYYLCQFPFPMTDTDIASRWPYTDSFDEFICYSSFVQHHLVAAYGEFSTDGRPINVVAPPVPQFNVGLPLVSVSAPCQILTIGRFFVGGHNKRHDVSITAVRQLTSLSREIDLHVVGSVATSHPAHAQHLSDLKASAKGLPIHFHVNASLLQISELMSECTIYIHAAGFEVDVSREPQRCEHFGISVLEAMSAGCIPFVVGNGGPAEFVQDGVNGFTYLDIDELVAKLTAAVDDQEALTQMRLNARATAATFSQATFDQRWISLLKPHLRAVDAGLG